jgi:hypothetical protein
VINLVEGRKYDEYFMCSAPSHLHTLAYWMSSRQQVLPLLKNLYMLTYLWMTLYSKEQAEKRHNVSCINNTHCCGIQKQPLLGALPAAGVYIEEGVILLPKRHCSAHMQKRTMVMRWSGKPCKS